MASDPAAVNQRVAERLREASDLLERQAANPFRIGAYRRAADTIEGLEEGVDAIFERSGSDGLEALPHVGSGIASAIAELLRSGRWSQLERLRGALDPVKLFQGVAGIGPALARRIHDALGVDTLEALEAAAFDGRLDSVPGIGHRRATAIRATLEMMLGRVPSTRRRKDAHGPRVSLILSIDADYREKAGAGELPTIAPKRFNPSAESWLPIMHADRDGWHFTALFSNTARAHELGRTRDWVVVYFYDDDHREGQHTVVTEHRGPLSGRRVVRGRESECRRHYEKGTG